MADVRRPKLTGERRSRDPSSTGIEPSGLPAAIDCCIESSVASRWSVSVMMPTNASYSALIFCRAARAASRESICEATLTPAVDCNWR